MREYDLFVRYGGDEFVILMPETGPNEALVVLERIRLIASEYKILDTDSSLTVSCGVCSGIPNRSENLAYYINEADIELYKSKESGRNRINLKQFS